ncbi:MAG: glycosyltransferase [Nitrospiraceae bacterium]
MGAEAHERGIGTAVSVVMATYNYGRYLPQAIESVLAQTYRDWELIVINDGSTDDTDEVMQPYALMANIRYYTKPNGGQASAKNFGIRLARGEYVAFLDADDWWHPTKLAKQVRLFENNDRVGVVYSGMRAVNSEGEELQFGKAKYFRGRVLEHLFGENFVPFSSSMVRRALLEKEGMFDESLEMGIDYDLWLRCSLVTEFDYVPESVVVIRWGHAQISSNAEGREYWARFIEERFRAKHPGRATAGMIRNRDYQRSYTRLQRSEGVDNRGALRAALSMVRLHPWSATSYIDVARVLMKEFLLGSNRKYSVWLK